MKKMKNENLDVDQFLNLPDWKKIQLKKKHGKFMNYPLQSVDDENRRINIIIALCAHFSNKTYDEFTENKMEISAFHQWPRLMELFLTPKLLDVIEFRVLTRFAYCQYCNHFTNSSKIAHLKYAEYPLHILYGNCKLIEEKCKHKKYDSEVFKRVKPSFRCIEWSPVKLYETLMDLYIRQQLLKSDVYPYNDYKKDLNTINIVDYFINEYYLDH